MTKFDVYSRFHLDYYWIQRWIDIHPHSLCGPVSFLTSTIVWTGYSLSLWRYKRFPKCCHIGIWIATTCLNSRFIHVLHNGLQLDAVVDWHPHSFIEWTYISFHFDSSLTRFFIVVVKKYTFSQVLSYWEMDWQNVSNSRIIHVLHTGLQLDAPVDWHPHSFSGWLCIFFHFDSSLHRIFFVVVK